MGDDLTAARRFCDSVRGDISELIENICAEPCAAEDVLIGSLDRIQSSAKRLHARAIFRAAQTVVNAVNDRAPLPTVQGRILSLNKLVVQYESGLDDIAPRPANGEFENEEPFDSPLVFATTQPPMPDVEARFRAARAALLPLMSFATSGQEREALTRLAKFSEDELESASSSSQTECVKPELSEASGEAPDILGDILGDVLSETDAIQELDVAAFQTADTLAPPAPKMATPSFAPRLHIDFENVMSGFISHALQEARLTDKTVSVSYGADGVSVAEQDLPALQYLLEHIAQTFVRSVLERPETRRARGQSGAGHIAVTATQNSKALTISIECPGAPVAVNAFVPKERAPEGLKVTPGANAHDGLAHIVLTVPRRNAAPRPVNVSEIAS